MDVTRASQATAAQVWADLDEPWREAFRQGWEALHDKDGPVGEIFGSALAHAEMNVLARLPFRSQRNLVLSTTLQPCLQCAAAIRLGPIATVRFAGADRYWDGCHDFAMLSPREAQRAQPAREGPRSDELGVFGALMSRMGVGLWPRYEEALRELGEGPSVDLARRLAEDGEFERLAAMEVNEALAYLWPRLTELRSAR